MKKIIIWLFIAVFLMIILPWSTVSFAGSSGMAVCLILFFAVYPLFSASSGIFAGTNISRLWFIPVISPVAFLCGAWLFFDMGETDFLLYASAYFIIGICVMLITALIVKTKRNNLFHIFKSQEQRRKFGGSAFIEIQFCKLPKGTDTKECVSVDNIENWKNDSLYVSDENEFYKEYSTILDCGIYNNLQSGTVDIYGINYYSPSATALITKRIKERKPKDCDILTNWLLKAKDYNGIYILGI